MCQECPSNTEATQETGSTTCRKLFFFSFLPWCAFFLSKFQHYIGSDYSVQFSDKTLEALVSTIFNNNIVKYLLIQFPNSKRSIIF